MTTLMHFVLQSQRVILDFNRPPEPAAIEVKDGKIKAIYPGANVISPFPVIDYGDSVIMPALVDTHAHINEPGRTDWEGFETATRAAASGGIAVVIDMPLNCIPPTTTLANLAAKTAAAEGKCSIDYGFWGGAIPGNSAEFAAMVEKGVPGFKAFMIDSGVEEFPMSTESDLRAAMTVLASLKVPLLVHAELDQRKFPPSLETNPRAYKKYVDSRPAHWEVDAIKLVIRLMRETGCQVHIVHLSAAEALPEIVQAKSEALPLTVETCPHYLTLSAEEIAEGATQFKCAPPIRGAANRDQLWAALVSGAIDFIVSDHSPCTPALKLAETGDFDKAWGGIAGLQFSLSAIWTEMHRRGLPLERLAKWMSAGPAKFAGLEARKGSLAPGKDADLTVWEPEQSFEVTPESIRHRHPVTPYSGRTLLGKVHTTFVRGVAVYEEGVFSEKPLGQLICGERT